MAEGSRQALPPGSTKPHWLRSLVTKQTIFVTVVVLLISQTLSLVGFLFARQVIVERVEYHLDSIAKERRARLMGFIEQQHERVKLVASRTRLRDLIEEHANDPDAEPAFVQKTQRILGDAQASITGFQAIWFADLKGIVIAASNPRELGRDFSADEAFTQGKEGPHIGVPTIADTRGRYSAFLTSPAKGKSGEVIGVMIVQADMQPLEDLLEDPTGIGNTGEVIVGAPAGDDIVYLLPSRGVDRIRRDQASALNAAIDGESDFAETNYAGDRVLTRYLPIDYHKREHRPWGMIAKMDVSEAYKPLTKLGRILLMLQLGFLTAGIVFSYLLVRRTMRPIQRLGEAAAAVASGDLNVEVPATSMDEVGVLSRAFNQMTAELRESYGALEERVASRTTELREQNQELEATQRELMVAKMNAEAASQAKGEFLATMSHEIRTPMNAVIGMTELVLDTDLTEVQREYLAMVKDSAESLLSLINDILDFSKIEAGKLELDHAPFSVRESLGDLMKVMAMRVRGRDIELICRIAPDVPSRLAGDSLRLRQIVTNLIGNALKFTEAGEVLLDLTVESRTEEQVTLSGFVRDTGIGVPAEKQQLIFTAFSQGDSTTTRRFGGTGLGLAITARLVELMGGRIWLESEVGRGSTFYFTLQLEIAPDAEPDIADTELLNELRVLIVDDNRTNRMILTEMTANWGMQATTLADAKSAIQEMRRAFQNGQPYELVLTDAHMPEVDGFQFMHEIKVDADLDSPVVLMLSSGDDLGDIARCKSLGGSAHLIKPVKQSDLFDAIVAAVTQDRRGESREAPTVEPGVGDQRIRILLAEDSFPNQRLMIGVLKKWGHEIAIANNGKEAIEKLQTEGPFDVVFMDVQMPIMDGFEATRAIRERESASDKRTPIIAVTAHAMKGDREACLNSGMDDYVSKPIRNAELIRVLTKWVPQSSNVPDDPVPTESVRLNWKSALETVGGDTDLLQEVLAAIIEENPQCIDSMREAISADDSTRLIRAAHTFRGNLRLFGDTEAADIAARIERLGKEQHHDDAAQLLNGLSVECERVVTAIKESEFAKRPHTGHSESE